MSLVSLYECMRMCEWRYENVYSPVSLRGPAPSVLTLLFHTLFDCPVEPLYSSTCFFVYHLIAFDFFPWNLNYVFLSPMPK